MATHHSAATHNEVGGQGEGKIRCSHLLVKHRDSRRPSSWREAEITRSKEEAIEILKGHERRIQSGEATLGDIAVSESDCSSARKKGDLYVLILPLKIMRMYSLSTLQWLLWPWGDAKGVRRCCLCSPARSGQRRCRNSLWCSSHSTVCIDPTSHVSSTVCLLTQ